MASSRESSTAAHMRLWPFDASTSVLTPLPIPAAAHAHLPQAATALSAALLFRFARIIAPDARVLHLLAEWLCAWAGLMDAEALPQDSTAAVLKPASGSAWQAVNVADARVLGDARTSSIRWFDGVHVLGPAACIVAALCWIGSPPPDEARLPLPSSTNATSPVREYYESGRRLDAVRFLKAIIRVFVRDRAATDAFGVDIMVCCPEDDAAAGSKTSASNARVDPDDWQHAMRQIGHRGVPVTTALLTHGPPSASCPPEVPMYVKLPAGWARDSINVRVVPILLTLDCK